MQLSSLLECDPTVCLPERKVYLVSDAKIFDIIYQLSPLLECDPTVCLPEKSKVTRGLAIIVCNVARGSINIYDVVNILFSLGDKLSGRGFAKIFDIIYKISSPPTATNLSLDAMFVVC
jgi:hypothetical protein